MSKTQLSRLINDSSDNSDNTYDQLPNIIKYDFICIIINAIIFVALDIAGFIISSNSILHIHCPTTPIILNLDMWLFFYCGLDCLITIFELMLHLSTWYDSGLYATYILNDSDSYRKFSYIRFSLDSVISIAGNVEIVGFFTTDSSCKYLYNPLVIMAIIYNAFKLINVIRMTGRYVYRCWVG